MIFATEKFKSLVAMLSKIYDHGKATNNLVSEMSMSLVFLVIRGNVV